MVSCPPTTTTTTNTKDTCDNKEDLEQQEEVEELIDSDEESISVSDSSLSLPQQPQSLDTKLDPKVPSDGERKASFDIRPFLKREIIIVSVSVFETETCRSTAGLWYQRSSLY